MDIIISANDAAVTITMSSDDLCGLLVALAHAEEAATEETARTGLNREAAASYRNLAGRIKAAILAGRG